MKRPYKIVSVVNKISRIRNLNPKLKINTHVITGFPGETSEDFLATLNLIKDNLFDRVKIFGYSDRPGTEASLLANKIDPCIIRTREKKVMETLLWTNLKKLSISNLLLNSKTLS